MNHPRCYLWDASSICPVPHFPASLCQCFLIHQTERCFCLEASLISSVSVILTSLLRVDSVYFSYTCHNVHKCFHLYSCGKLQKHGPQYVCNSPPTPLCGLHPFWLRAWPWELIWQMCQSQTLCKQRPTICVIIGFGSVSCSLESWDDHVTSSAYRDHEVVDLRICDKLRLRFPGPASLPDVWVRSS